MIVLNAADSTEISFEMGIEGNASTVNNVFLVIESNNGFDIRIPADFSANTVKASIPVLDHILCEGEYNMNLEVQIDGKVYVPLNETVKVEKPVSVIAKILESQNIVDKEGEAPRFSFRGISKSILQESTKLDVE